MSFLARLSLFVVFAVSGPALQCAWAEPAHEEATAEAPVELSPSASLGKLDSATGIIAPGIATQTASPTYPTMARRIGEQGEVRLKYTVTTEGRATNVSVVSSSGHPDLDAAAIKDVENWHWNPATRNGVPIAVRMQFVVTYKLQKLDRLPGGAHRLELYTQVEMPADLYPAAALAAKEEGVVSLEILVKTDGTVSGVSIVHSSGSSTLDKASEEIAAKNWHYNPLTIEGYPARAITLVALVWRLPKTTQ